MRKEPDRWALLLSMILSMLGVVVVVTYLISRIMTDRYVWSQWVWWVPAGWFVVGVWGLLGAGLVVGLIGKRQGKGAQRAQKNRARLGVRVLLLTGCLGVSWHHMFGVLRIQNAVGGYGIHWTRTEQHGRVRVLHWNIASGKFDEERVVEQLSREHIDVALLANTRWDGQRQVLVDKLTTKLVDDFYGFGEAGVVQRMARAVVVSRYPILRASTVYLSASGSQGTEREEAERLRASGDFGWVLMLRLDGGEKFGEFDVWMVDLPSEPTVHRTALMGRVVELIESNGQREAPALIIGDFNTVRGSASLAKFDVFEQGDGFVDAFEARGAGSGSWRSSGLSGLQGWFAERSSWHIDLSLVGNGWSVDGYELLVPDGTVWGEGVTHKAQVVDISRD